jgi:S-formylglutathione hydrolase
VETISEHACFGGTQGFYRHQSRVIGLPMKFSVYMPPQAKTGKVPTLFYLAGLTCNEETFPIKAGAQKFAAEHGVMLIAPDTSPRETGIDGATNDWDVGEGAGFYLDATLAPWSKYFQMESYIVDELYELITSNFSADKNRIGIFGHSMGGHGALTLALRHRDIFKSVSAFAPIAAPTQCPWGEKAFTRYLGNDKTEWAQYDASMLMREMKTPFPHGILIDQGLGDKFLAEQLHPHEFESVCKIAHQSLTLDRHAGYDHGYYFIASFMEKHIAFHAKILSSQ